jgi:hypothetical protein
MKPFICPQPGRRILHVDCAEMQQHSIEAATAILLELGFDPEVEYRFTEGKLGFVLVLDNQPFDHDFGAAFDAIAERLDPDCECIHVVGWPQSVAVPQVAVAA